MLLKTVTKDLQQEFGNLNQNLKSSHRRRADNLYKFHETVQLHADVVLLSAEFTADKQTGNNIFCQIQDTQRFERHLRVNNVGFIFMGAIDNLRIASNSSSRPGELSDD